MYRQIIFWGVFAGVASAQVQVLQSIVGAGTGNEFGYSVAKCGDLNGDGFHDFVIGASNGAGSFPVTVVGGPSGQTMLSIPPDAPATLFGQVVASGGDLNGDGVNDIAISARLADFAGTNSGRIKVVSGTDASLLLTLDGALPGAFLGWSIDLAGDANGDSHSDLLIGSPIDPPSASDYGRVTMISGIDSTVLWSIVGTTPGGQFGRTVVFLGDINSDGFDDVLCSVPFDQYGRVEVRSGNNGSMLYSVSAPQNSCGCTYYGLALARLDDLSGDGTPDFIVGASEEENLLGISVGSARVYSGANGALLHTKLGATVSGSFGASVANAGDIDDDGVPEFAVGAYNDSTAAQWAGAVFVYSGMTGQILHSGYGTAPNENIGFSIASAGDFLGIGRDVVAVGAPHSSPNGMVSGSVSVYGYPPEFANCTGNVGIGFGGPFNLLTINGSSGVPTRQVNVPIGAPITIAVSQPPANPFPAAFVIVGHIGAPAPADATILPFGIGTLCFPSPHLTPAPGLFVLTNNFGPDMQLVSSAPTPWSITVNGLPFPFQFALQGVIQQDPGAVKTTNGVLVNIQ